MTRLVRAFLLSSIVVAAAISPLTGLALVIRDSFQPNSVVASSSDADQASTASWWDKLTSLF